MMDNKLTLEQARMRRVRHTGQLADAKLGSALIDMSVLTEAPSASRASKAIGKLAAARKMIDEMITELQTVK